ncbi:MAG: hypothetical protein JO356_12115 [Acidobacteria bacterium]|nr:hypothetical protein [Acidobacteriota bacterium]
MKITDEPAAKSARLLVADCGNGVPNDALPWLFEPFYRVPGSSASKSDGSGLGLSIAKRVATFHGGNISARNRAQGGLEIEIRLPARELVT